MKISVKFKHLPSGGKSIKNGKYYVTYNSKGNVWDPDNVQRVYRLPKFLWDRL